MTGPDSLSIFPSELEHDVTRAPAAATVPAAQRPFRQSRSLPVARFVIVFAIAMLAVTGVVLRRPDHAVSPETSNLAQVITAAPVVGAQPLRNAEASLSTPMAVDTPVAPVTPVETSAVAQLPAQTRALVRVPEVETPQPRKPSATPLQRKTSASRAAKPAAFTGTLVVQSVPQGATVLINQRPAGVTPLRLTNYPAGSYAIWVEREGFQRWTAGVRVPADTVTLINPVLRSN